MIFPIQFKRVLISTFDFSILKKLSSFFKKIIIQQKNLTGQNNVFPTMPYMHNIIAQEALKFYGWP